MSNSRNIVGYEANEVRLKIADMEIRDLVGIESQHPKAKKRVVGKRLEEMAMEFGFANGEMRIEGCGIR